MFDESSSHPRRRFLGRAAASIAALAAGFPSIARAGGVGDSDESEHDAWMKPLKGRHRQFFHAVQAQDIPMLMASNFLNAYSEAFKSKQGEANAVIGMHGGALSIGFNHGAWAKYSLGKVSSVTDPATKEPAVRNIFATGGDLSVEAMQKRGVVFLLCNTALRLRSRGIAAERGETPDAVYSDLKASVLPGVILVPALVVTINRAQEAGFTYIRA